MTACLDAGNESAKPESQKVECDGCFDSLCPKRLMEVSGRESLRLHSHCSVTCLI